jgi:hypothetical protein
MQLVAPLNMRKWLWPEKSKEGYVSHRSKHRGYRPALLCLCLPLMTKASMARILSSRSHPRLNKPMLFIPLLYQECRRTFTPTLLLACQATSQIERLFLAVSLIYQQFAPTGCTSSDYGCSGLCSRRPSCS